MKRFADAVRHDASVVFDRLVSSFHLSAAKLLWALGIAAVLLPAAAYAWGMDTSENSSLRDDHSSPNATSHVEESAPVSDDSNLHVEAGGAGGPIDNTSRSSEAYNAQNVQLHVNGEAVPLPSNGTVHKEFPNQDSNTSVDISIESSSSGTSHSHSSTSMDIELNSSTRSESDDAG